MNRERLALASGWAYTAVRVLLSLAMIAFGMVKVVPTQFITFTLPGAMLVPLGDSSPSGMLWKFMATSTPYTVITGAVEVLGGLLLIFRRTTLLGALVSAVALVQVSILNLSYGVPVILTPLLMLAMALVVALPWWSRLLDVLIRNRDSVALPEPPAAGRRRRRAGTLAHLAAAAVVIAAMGANGIRSYNDYTERISPLDGVWAVDTYEGAGPRWVRLAIDARPAAQRLAVTRDTGELLTTELSIDAATSRLRLDDSTLDYRQHDSTLRLTGEFDGTPVDITLHRIPLRGETRDFR
ncbi:hypothetical protein FOH10_10705 [Nocardia otitidiscaviarum]|uniref:DoxX family membrane protein n=1 Tax=Nocardia otitidiscaviarum TaxID=1823 RepID=A0A516NJR7_9NOCA|nr:hypothetical protein [Nocardia otitidiscaviarum]MCP9619025.1 hypothetical protein [Nocardia otitidiscaviarum]QDP79129.1 hypothetical protein FOH10_10705 [Nocardia otitidiscaviarum]